MFTFLNVCSTANMCVFSISSMVSKEKELFERLLSQGYQEDFLLSA